MARSFDNFKKSIPKQRKILYVKLHFSLLNIQFFGFGQNFRKMAARNLTLGARAAVYRGAAVLFGAEERCKQCAEGAEKIFFQKLYPETAQNSLCEIAFFFTKHSIFRLWAKFSKNAAEESRLGARPAG